MPHDEDTLLDALARLHAAGADSVGEGSRYVGSFRAHGLVVPVWDLAEGTVGRGDRGAGRRVRRPAGRGAGRHQPARRRRSGGPGPGCAAGSSPCAEAPATVKRVLLTGMSGAGKSSVVRELVARGYKAVDTDDGWCEPLPDGRQQWREAPSRSCCRPRTSTSCSWPAARRTRWGSIPSSTTSSC